MFTILPSHDASTIAIEIRGNITAEDAEKLNQHVGEKVGDDSFNILAIFHDMETTTIKGFVEGSKFDNKRWDQFNKFAIVSDKKWIELSTKAGDYLPGLRTKHFDRNELDKAWDWITQDDAT